LGPSGVMSAAYGAIAAASTFIPDLSRNEE
jgi:hypothetical protein